MFDAADWMTDPTVVSSFDPALQDMLSNVSDISGMVDDIVADAGTSTPGDIATTWAPPLNFLPDPYLPEPFIPDLIHREEFTLNGFPYQGQDPTAPGYWSPPSF